MSDPKCRPLALTIAPAAPKAPLSAPQRTFNRLSQQIANTERDLQDWERAMADTQQRVITDLLPAQQQYLALRIQLLQQLDGSSQAIKLGNVARETLSQVIVQLAAELIMEYPDDTTLREIHQRHGGAEVMDIESLADFFDFRSGDAAEEVEETATGPESFTDFMERLIKDRLAAQMETLRRERREARGAAAEPVDEAPERPRTGAQKARDTQQAAQAENIRQALRTIYRQLVSMVHPDRETDPERREQKTALMQRANQAYAGKDLLQLLALQQDLGQIDPEALSALAVDHLKTYNQALKEHLARLKARVQDIQQRAAAGMGGRFLPHAQQRALSGILRIRSGKCDGPRPGSSRRWWPSRSRRHLKPGCRCNAGRYEGSSRWIGIRKCSGAWMRTTETAKTGDGEEGAGEAGFGVGWIHPYTNENAESLESCHVRHHL